METLLAAWREHPGTRTLVFCCTIRHAEYAKGWLAAKGIRCEAVHGGPGSFDREDALASLRDGNLDWTVVRPSGLFDAPGVTGYELHEDRAPGIFTSRADLAAALLDQATDTRFRHRNVAVTTTEGIPTVWQMLRREALGRD